MKSILTLINNTTLAGKGVIFSLSALLAVIISMKAILVGLAILIVIDLITGIRANLHDWGIASNPLKRVFWISIKSYLLRKTWKKMYEYGIGVVVIATLETMFFGTPITIMLMEKAFTLTELAALIPALVEVWSIFENFEAVSNKNILKRLIRLLPSRIRDIITGDNKQIK